MVKYGLYPVKYYPVKYNNILLKFEVAVHKKLILRLLVLIYTDLFYYSKIRTPHRHANLTRYSVTAPKAVGRWRAILSPVLPRKSPTEGKLVELKHLSGSYLPAVSEDREEKKMPCAGNVC